MTQGPCPPEQRLAAFVEGSLSGEERNEVSLHLDTCATCFDLTASLAGVINQPLPAVDPALRSRVETQSNPRWLTRALPTLSAAAVFLVALVWWKAPSQPVASSATPSAQTTAGAPNPEAVRAGRDESAVRLEQPRDGDLLVGRPELRWTGPATATSYEIQVTTSSGDLLWKRQVDGTQHSVRLETDLPVGRHCYVWVAAYLVEGRRLTSNIVHVTAAER
jgi:Putative zinc-finger